MTRAKSLPAALGLFMLLLLSATDGHARTSAVQFPILYFDMDGTLLNSSHEIQPATLETLKKYQACGGKVGIATGRSLVNTKQYLSIVSPDLPTILDNGSIITTADGERALRIIELPDNVWKPAIKTALRLRGKILGVLVETISETVLDRSDKPFMDMMGGFGFVNCRVDPNLTLLNNENPIKIMLWVKPASIRQIKNLMSKAVGDAANVLETGKSIDVAPKGTDKATAIEYALKGTGFSLDKDVVTVGDSGNDAAMLEKAAYGFAMRNCTTEACQAADAIIGSNDSEAIADMIRHLAVSSSCKIK